MDKDYLEKKEKIKKEAFKKNKEKQKALNDKKLIYK